MSNTKWLLRVFSAVKWSVAAGLALFALKIVANLAMTGVQKWVVDDVFVAEEYAKAAPLLAVFAGAVIAFNAFHAIAARFLDSSAFRITRHLTSDLMHALHRMPAAAIRSERTGKFVQHLTDDIHGVASLIQGFVPNGIQHALTVILLGGIVGWAHPALLAAIVAIGGLYIALGRRYGPPTKAAAKDVRAKRAELLVEIEEGVAASREVVAFHRIAWEKRRFERRFAAYFEAVLTEGRLENRQLFATAPLRWAVTFAVLGIGGVAVIRQQMSLGTFVVVYQFAVQLVEGIQGLFGFFMQASSRMAAVERVRGMLDGAAMPEGGAPLAGPVRSLALRDVRFRYAPDAPYVLNGVTLELPVGRKIAFVGMSGGGKSTIAQLLVRFYEPEAGELEVNGRALSGVTRESWEERVRIVFQEPYLFPDTIRTNLMMGRETCADEAALREACRIAHIDEFIDSLEEGFDTVIGERGIQLSGGQRQRLALARALLDRPDILILDEATSSLDLETERRVQQGIDAARLGMTTIVIAHRLSTVRNADVIYVMKDGVVAEAGAHDDLMSRSGEYAALVRREHRPSAG